MGHGGKRTGAGRKRKLTWEERQYIGALCENEVEAEERRQAEARAKKRRQEARKTLARLIRARRGFIRRLRHLPKSSAKQRLRETAKKAIKQLSAKIDGIGRYHSEPIRRLKGCRAKIIRTVAEKTSQTERMVTRCWVERRAMLKRLSRQLKRLKGDTDHEK